MSGWTGAGWWGLLERFIVGSGRRYHFHVSFFFFLLWWFAGSLEPLGSFGTGDWLGTVFRSVPENHLAMGATCVTSALRLNGSLLSYIKTPGSAGF